MLKRGTLIGNRYRIIRHLARGGMSEIYLARSVHSLAQWVVKEIRTDTGLDDALLQDCLRAEIATLKELEHPSLVRVVDVIRTESALCMVMEYVPGKTLEQHIRESGPLDEEEAVGICLQICDALGYLHSRDRRIIYRDLKPSNIILRPDKRAVLIDFGAAYNAGTKTYYAMGTRGFAAPEQYHADRRPQAASDVYAMGRTLRAMLTGSPTGGGRLRGISHDLRRVIRRCTHAKPQRRYTQVAELYYELKHLHGTGLKVRCVALSKFLVFLMFFVPAAAGILLHLTGHAQPRYALLLCAVPSALTWYFARIPDALAVLTGLSSRRAIARNVRSARLNGVFRIGKNMIAKEAVSWQDVEVPLDEAMTDVRIDFDSRKVKFIVMEGFCLERDEVVTVRENYRFIS